MSDLLKSDFLSILPRLGEGYNLQPLCCIQRRDAVTLPPDERARIMLLRHQNTASLGAVLEVAAELPPAAVPEALARIAIELTEEHLKVLAALLGINELQARTALKSIFLGMEEKGFVRAETQLSEDERKLLCIQLENLLLQLDMKAIGQKAIVQRLIEAENQSCSSAVKVSYCEKEATKISEGRVGDGKASNRYGATVVDFRGIKGALDKLNQALGEGNYEAVQVKLLFDRENQTIQAVLSKPFSEYTESEKVSLKPQRLERHEYPLLKMRTDDALKRHFLDKNDTHRLPIIFDIMLKAAKKGKGLSTLEMYQIALEIAPERFTKEEGGQMRPMTETEFITYMHNEVFRRIRNLNEEWPGLLGFKIKELGNDYFLVFDEYFPSPGDRMRRGNPYPVAIQGNIFDEGKFQEFLCANFPQLSELRPLDHLLLRVLVRESKRNRGVTVSIIANDPLVRDVHEKNPEMPRDLPLLVSRALHDLKKAFSKRTDFEYIRQDKATGAYHLCTAEPTKVTADAQPHLRVIELVKTTIFEGIDAKPATAFEQLGMPEYSSMERVQGMPEPEQPREIIFDPKSANRIIIEGRFHVESIEEFIFEVLGLYSERKHPVSEEDLIAILTGGEWPGIQLDEEINYREYGFEHAKVGEAFARLKNEFKPGNDSGLEIVEVGGGYLFCTQNGEASGEQDLFADDPVPNFHDTFILGTDGIPGIPKGSRFMFVNPNRPKGDRVTHKLPSAPKGKMIIALVENGEPNITKVAVVELDSIEFQTAQDRTITAPPRPISVPDRVLGGRGSLRDATSYL